MRSYLVYLCDDLMKRIPLDYWTLVVLISNLENVISANNIQDENMVELIKYIYAEAIGLIASSVKSKPENDDIIMAISSLPERVRKEIRKVSI